MDRRAVLTGMMALAAPPVIGFAKSRRKRRKRHRGKAKTGAVADAVLAPLAAMMGHGTDDEGLTVEDLEWRIAQGQRVIVLCGNQSSVGVRALQRTGIAARLINPLTRGTWNGATDGHTLLEARLDGRWQVYDMTANAQAVDAKGRGIDVTTLCQQRPHRWRAFASDPIWTATSNAPADVAAWYDHVLQIPVIADNGY